MRASTGGVLAVVVTITGKYISPRSWVESTIPSTLRGGVLILFVGCIMHAAVLVQNLHAFHSCTWKTIIDVNGRVAQCSDLNYRCKWRLTYSVYAMNGYVVVETVPPQAIIGILLKKGVEE